MSADAEQGFTGPYSVEMFECLTWFEIANLPTLPQAMRVASQYAELLGEHRVMVTDSKCRVVA